MELEENKEKDLTNVWAFSVTLEGMEQIAKEYLKYELGDRRIVAFSVSSTNDALLRCYLSDRIKEN